jgi:N-acetylglucosamine malate deacetylase 1
MGGSRPQPTALLLSPHPDDELLGCPAHLFALREEGWRIVNLALSLGSNEAERPRRLGELEEACARAGFELIADQGDLGMPSSRAQAGDTVPERAVQRVLHLARGFDTRLLVSPSPHDDHPAHEWTGRLALAAARSGAAERLWLWGLWADIATPNSLCVFAPERLEQIEHALGAHTGELARNDYCRLLRARAQAGAILLPERVHGFGSHGLPNGALAEAVCDVHLGTNRELLLGTPVTFDARSFSSRPTAAIGVARWLDGPSPRWGGHGC